MKGRSIRLFVFINSLIFLVIFYNPTSIKAQTATAPSGSGTTGDPYRIATLNNLYWLSQTTSAWAAGNYFIQTADINASSTSSWNSGAGFTPIGNSTTFFEGNYNGNGHTIDGLYINQPSTTRLALFGTIANTTVQNLGVTNVNINGGSDHVGAVVAVDRSSTILKCYSTGTITSNATNVGGIIGYNNEYCTVSNSYSTVSILNNSTYANIGGLVGRNFDRSTVTNSYSIGSVTSTANNVGGFCGWNAGTITNSFWNTSIVSTGIGSGTTTGVSGKTTTQMQSQSTFTGAGWDFKGETANGTNEIWGINSFDNNGYPFLSWQGYIVAVIPAGSGSSADPYQIATLDNLFWVTQNSSSWSKFFKQTANIDASSSSGWNGGTGFSPIGTQTVFSGSYDGNGHTINGLYINNNSLASAGLFGITSSSAIIKNLGVTNVDFTGKNTVGAIVGISFGGKIESCYSTGNIQADSIAGGIVGYALALGNINSIVPFRMSVCHSSVTINANYSGGGLIGFGQGTSFDSTAFSITDCYSTGIVQSPIYAGGLVAVITDGTIDNSCANGGGVVSTIGGGGLVGESNNSTISNCYVKNLLNFGTGTNNGGLIGRVSSSTINNCYATYYLILDGGIDPEAFHDGGLIGIKYSGTVNNSFWDYSQITYSDGGTGISTTQLKTSSTFLNAGWSSSIWHRDDSRNNGFPYLAWQNPSGTPLPVELTSFTAKLNDDNSVLLTWKTATELNNYGFEILRSSIASSSSIKSTSNDEKSWESTSNVRPPLGVELSESWETLGFVQGAGNSNSEKEYTFADNPLSAGTYQYKLKQIDNNGQFKYSDIVEIEVNSIPSKFELAQNFPNPFNPSTAIRYSLPVRQAGVAAVDALSPVEVHVSLIVYDILGNEVATLVNEKQSAGNYQVEFNASQLASGVYLYRLQTSSGFIATKKLMLLK